MLLALHMLALGVGTIMFLGIIILHRRAHRAQSPAHPGSSPPASGSEFARCPARWLAVRSANPRAVLSALGLNCLAPCPWAEGLAGDHEFFIGPPLQDWIIVTGSGLPHPGRDVDRCFHFLTRLSRVLGQVQFFLADPLLKHHAWVRMENGAVKRAYVWADGTTWNQGAKSVSEIELNMRCFGYGEDASRGTGASKESAAANVKKVPSLAARWSFDPTALAEYLPGPSGGITGKSSQFCQD
jgi:hypothetical protein